MISNSKLQKLRSASAKAKTDSQKQKLLSQAEVLDKTVDQKIQSVALNKFVLRKAQKLKELGKTKTEISTILIDLQTSMNSETPEKMPKLSGFGIDDKFVGKSIESILKSVNAYDKKLNKINVQKEKQKSLKVNVNPDTVTQNEIQKNNEKIYDYLVKQGEIDIANYLVKLMQPKEEPLKTSEIQKGLQGYTDEVKKLSLINSGIYDELKAIREQQVDEQKTEIPVQERLKQEIQIQKTKQLDPEKDSGLSASAFWNILKIMGLGSSVAYFAGLFDDENFKKALGFIKEGDFKGLVSHLGGLDWLEGIIKTAGVALIAKAIGPINGAIKLIRKVLMPNINLTENLSKMFNKLIKTLGKIPALSNYFKSFTSVTGTSIKNKDLTKLEKTTVTQKADKVSEHQKANAKKIQETQETKKSKKKVGKISTDAISKKGGKIASKLLKFTKVIPFLGVAIASGTAMSAAYDGYNNASEILDTPDNQLTEIHKVAAATGAALEDLLWPFNPDAKDTANLVLRAAGAMGIDTGPKKEEEPKKRTGLNYMDLSFNQIPNTKSNYNIQRDEKPDNYVFQKRNYSMDVPGKSTNPDDWELKDLFNLNANIESVQNLNPDVLHNLKAMGAEYLRLFGEKIQINSAFRSIEEQQKLKKKYGDKAAAPGSSMHNYGFAFDIQSNHANKAIKSGLFDKYGFWRPVRNERWHVEADGIDRNSIRIAGRRELMKEQGATNSVVNSDEMDISTPDKVSNSIDLDISKETEQQKDDALRLKLQELNKIEQEYIRKFGETEGKYIFGREYGRIRDGIKDELNISTPEISKVKNMQNIEQTQNSLMKSTVKYDSLNRAIPTVNNEPFNINSTTNLNNEEPSILNAFSEY